MRLDDVLGNRRQQFEAGRSKLAGLQALFDQAFGEGTCEVIQKTVTLVVYVDSSGLANQVQMQKHTLTKAIQEVEPIIRTVRIVIGRASRP